MDFIEELPQPQGKQCIFVVVNRLSKAGHFITLTNIYTAPVVAQSFLDNVFRLHGFPESIISVRDLLSSVNSGKN